MTEHEGQEPAFPQGKRVGDIGVVKGGMTRRQYAAIKLRVPDSGTKWLDAMIRKSLRNDLAAKAMQALIQTPYTRRPENQSTSVSEVAYDQADAMLKAGDVTGGAE